MTSVSAKPCPCCGCLTIEHPGRHEICPVCVWEDDPAQSADPHSREGGNWGCSLDEARKNYALMGASDPHWIADARPARPQEKP